IQSKSRNWSEDFARTAAKSRVKHAIGRVTENGKIASVDSYSSRDIAPARLDHQCVGPIQSVPTADTAHNGTADSERGIKLAIGLVARHREICAGVACDHNVAVRINGHRANARAGSKIGNHSAVYAERGIKLAIGLVARQCEIRIRAGAINPTRCNNLAVRLDFHRADAGALGKYRRRIERRQHRAPGAKRSVERVVRIKPYDFKLIKEVRRDGCARQDQLAIGLHGGSGTILVAAAKAEERCAGSGKGGVQVAWSALRPS